MTGETHPRTQQRRALPQLLFHCWDIWDMVLFSVTSSSSSSAPSFNVNQPVKWNVLFWSRSRNLFAQQINGHTSKQTWWLSKYLSTQKDFTRSAALQHTIPKNPGIFSLLFCLPFDLLRAQMYHLSHQFSWMEYFEAANMKWEISSQFLIQCDVTFQQMGLFSLSQVVSWIIFQLDTQTFPKVLIFNECT